MEGGYLALRRGVDRHGPMGAQNTQNKNRKRFIWLQMVGARGGKLVGQVCCYIIGAKGPYVTEEEY